MGLCCGGKAASDLYGIMSTHWVLLACLAPGPSRSSWAACWAAVPESHLSGVSSGLKAIKIEKSVTECKVNGCAATVAHLAGSVAPLPVLHAAEEALHRPDALGTHHCVPHPEVEAMA
jgi:hypothetical protein